MNYTDALVSAIITTYKRPIEIVKRAIISVLNQTHKKIEVIVVNDYPEDKKLSNEIAKMIKEFKNDKLKYICLSKNSGACKARNVGIMESKGDFIALLDDDDEWLENKIEMQLQGFIDDTIGMVYSPFYNIKQTGEKELCIRGTKSGNLSSELLWNNCLGGCSMPMIRRCVFDDCGYFDEDLLSSQDYDMWLRISQKYLINCVNIPLTNRYIQTESITSNYEKKQQGFEYLNKKHYELYISNRNAFNYRYNKRVNKLLEQGYVREALHTYKEALKIKLFSKWNFVEPFKGLIKLLKNKRRRKS